MSDLFDVYPPYVTGSDTSEEAAERVYGVTGKLRREVYNLLREHGGLTDNQMQELLHMNPSTQRPRRIELVEQGLVVDSGLRRVTKSGRRATVWAIKRAA